MVKSSCKQKLTLIIPSVCMLIAAAFIVISTITLPAILKQSIGDQLKMAPDTYEFWGQSPGQTKSVTKRNFTFFNFTNPRQFLYQNKTPVFHQIHGYLLQQRFNYTDYKYSQNMDQVFYNDWLYFTQFDQTRSLNEKVHIVNIGPLGFWYQLDLVGMPTFALQGFGGLFLELNQTFKTQAIGQGVSSQFLVNYTNWRSVCDNNQIPQLQCNNTWQDPQHGLNDQNNYQIWIDFAYMKDEEAQNYLKSYFGFNDMQIQGLQKLFYEWADTVNGIIDNWFCQGETCSSNYLTILQLSSGDVTANPPSGDAVDSICDTGNVTCIGQPQISKFLRNQFKTKFTQQKYQKLKFSYQTFSHLFTPYNGTLLNIGNLTKLFQTGQKFDISQNIRQRNSLLEEIKKQTHAQSVDHAFVIWQWVKYFTSEFVIKLSKGGSEKNSGIGGVFAQAFYESFSDFGNWIIDQYLSLLGLEQIGDCQTFAKQTISGLSTQKARMICQRVKDSNKFSSLFQPCFETLQGKQRFRLQHELSLNQFAEYCDTEDRSFYTVGMKIHENIFNHYNCSPSKGVKMCTNYQMSMKQFIHSSITLNPIPNSIKSYEKSLTAKQWNSQLSEIEYKNYLKQAYDNQNFDTQIFTEKQLIDMLSFDKLFSASMVMELMLQNDQQQFEKLYYWKNMTLLKNYIKFVTIQIGFGGFTQERSVRELLFGYEDPFLKNLKETDTMMGGDPSINPVIMLNQPNITQTQAELFPQSVYTGYSDIKLTRQYSSIFGHDYVTYNKTWYDGYEVRSEFISPYRSNVPVKGSDAIQNPPGIDQKTSVYCFIGNIYRTAQLDFTQYDEMYGVDLLSFTADKSFLASEQQYPPNRVYYQKFQGFHNVTFLGVPLHICKNNFYTCPQNWSELVKSYDEKGEYEIKGTEIDETILKVQPNTGALFFASVRLQTNYHFQSDVLFGPGPRMLPVTNVIRQGQIEEQIVDELFGALKMAFIIQKVLIILALIIILISFGMIFYRCYKQTEKKERSDIQKSLIQVDDQGSLISGSDTVIKPGSLKSLIGKKQTEINQQKQSNTVKDKHIQQNLPRFEQVNTIILRQSSQSQQVQSDSMTPNINATLAE